MPAATMLRRQPHRQPGMQQAERRASQRRNQHAQPQRPASVHGEPARKAPATMMPSMPRLSTPARSAQQHAQRAKDQWRRDAQHRHQNEALPRMSMMELSRSIISSAHPVLREQWRPAPTVAKLATIRPQCRWARRSHGSCCRHRRARRRRIRSRPMPSGCNPASIAITMPL